jgi:hypothetical protein
MSTITHNGIKISIELEGKYFVARANGGEEIIRSVSEDLCMNLAKEQIDFGLFPDLDGTMPPV